MINDQTVCEIVEYVIEQGSLSKCQICECWGIDDFEYKELQGKVLRDHRVELGAQRVGGFARRSPKGGRQSQKALGDEPILRRGWERITAERLQELFTQGELERLLGRFKDYLRQTRYHEKGIDRPSRVGELAAALVLRHGIDLFTDSDLRAHVAKKCRIKNLNRWHPGKSASIEFVRAVQFPDELAGILSPSTLPDYEYLEEIYRLPNLLSFQSKVKRALQDVLDTPGRRTIVTLPTGAGKTRVAVESIHDWLRDRYDSAARTVADSAVLWLAHTEELCEQAYECFKQVWTTSSHACPLLLVRFWGKYTQDMAKHQSVLQQILSHPSVLISTPQRVVNLLANQVQGSEGVVRNLKSALGLLLIDEAHRAAAPSYRRILENLVPRGSRVAVAGLTATPFRMEYLADDPEEGTRDLQEIFKELIEAEHSDTFRQRLQDEGVLAIPEFRTIKTPISMRISNLPQSDQLSENDIERVDRMMAILADKSARRVAILKYVLPIAKDEKNSILYFGPSVQDAECMTYLLRREGITSAFVSGKTRDVTRRAIIGDFKQGNIRVLCNYNVLTTGFDAPRVTHVVMARPTVSRVLYEQILGRGLRGPKFGGTKTCTILDCEDNFKDNRPPLGYEAFRRVWNCESTGANPFTDGQSLDCLEEALLGAI